MSEELWPYEAIESFSATTPFPRNQRIISFAGTIPHCACPEYRKFENLLWKLWTLDQKTVAPITLLIHSTGGNAESTFLYYDFIKALRSPIRTIAMGGAHSAAALILTLGTKGSRFIMPHAKIALHSPQLCDLIESPSLISRIWPRKNKRSQAEIIIDVSTQTYARMLLECTCGKILNILGEWQDETSQEEKICGICDILAREVILSAKDAVEYGLADHIASPRIIRNIFDS